MKLLTCISFCLLILAISMSELVTYGIFKYQQDYIAQNLCVNRFQPELMCYGSCVLEQQLEKEQERSDFAADAQTKVVSLYCSTLPSLSVMSPLVLPAPACFASPVAYQHMHTTAIDRPPILA